MKYIWEQEIFITKMRIAINGMYLTNQAVGIANVIINVANQLVKKHEITIFANKQVLPEIKQRLDSSITYCENHNKLFFRKPIWFFLKFPKLLNSNSFDLLWNPAVWSPLFLRKKMKNLRVNPFLRFPAPILSDRKTPCARFFHGLSFSDKVRSLPK